MSLSTKIRNIIVRLSDGKSFGYADLNLSREEYTNAAKVLERLQKDGLIKRFSKGVFYKPEKTIFGELIPVNNELLKPYMNENGKRVAYETGTVLYNRMGLTTQMAFRTKIASRNKRVSINREAIKADAVKSYVDVTENNYQLLGVLDAIKDIRQIPDSNIAQSVKIITGIINSLPDKEKSKLIKYALLYPPRARALVGAILENLATAKKDLKALNESLNPLTQIKLGLDEQDLPTVKNWNIV